jgi:hypothetical protein
MTERRSAHRTQWAAQHAVASELCKRNYQVAMTMGNHPLVDLMVISPKGKEFSIDVKGLYKKNFWGVRERPLIGLLYYVFAFVPDDEPNQFFAVPQDKVNEEIRRVIEMARTRAIAAQRSAKFPGVSWNFVQAYKDS